MAGATETKQPQKVNIVMDFVKKFLQGRYNDKLGLIMIVVAVSVLYFRSEWVGVAGRILVFSGTLMVFAHTNIIEWLKKSKKTLTTKE